MSAVVPTPYQPFTVSVVPDRQEVAVVPAGDLDLSAVDRLAGDIREVRNAGFDRILLDLRRLTFLDFSGLRLLLSLRNDAKHEGHHLWLVPGRPEVRRVFDLTGTHGLFEWRNS